ncbi:hypothetical protein WME75_28245 [Sorangium sp. So ce1014]|uniref:hypothetical protein n=1 Tax=Sorangium sp. So ce1014 TaxID=3133326 RepID=UPI003F5DA23E
MWNYAPYALSACSFLFDMTYLLLDAQAGRPIDLPRLLLSFAAIVMTRPPRRGGDG